MPDATLSKHCCHCRQFSWSHSIQGRDSTHRIPHKPQDCRLHFTSSDHANKMMSSRLMAGALTGLTRRVNGLHLGCVGVAAQKNQPGISYTTISSSHRLDCRSQSINHSPRFVNSYHHGGFQCTACPWDPSMRWTVHFGR